VKVAAPIRPRATIAPLPELEARVDGLVQQMWQVVDNELVHAGVRFEVRPSRDVSVKSTPGLSPSPEPSPSESAAPSPTESTSPAPTESTPPAPSPTG
jgi:hypothetical protein